MNLTSTTALICTGLILAGCGSSGGSTDIASQNNFSNGVSNAFAPNFLDSGETEFDALVEGIVYYVGNLDGTVDEVLVRVNEDRDTLFVSFNGGDEIVFDTPIGPVTNDGTVFQATFASNFGDPDEQQVNVRVDGGIISSSIITRDNIAPVAIGGLNNGFGGLETMVDNLPPTTAEYEGEFVTFVEDPDEDNMVVNTLDGITTTGTVTIDFANASLSGSHVGTTQIGIVDGDVSGEISGEVAGSRAAGQLIVTGDNSGVLDFGGLFTGANGNNLVGGVAGTVNDGTQDVTTGGEFNLIQQ